MANLTPHNAEPTTGELTGRPNDDIAIKPRSVTRMLTNEGVVDKHIEAESSESPIPADAPETPVDPRQDALEALLDKAEAEAAPSSGETPDDGKTEAPNFDAPEMAAFADQFKKLMGVDLKDAFEQFTTMSQTMAQQQTAIAEQTSQVAVKSLQDKWGVNDAEFNTRVQSVLDYTNKLTPELRAQFDSVDGIDAIWGRLQRNAPTASATKQGNAPTAAPGQTFRKSELQEMMIRNPKLYSKLQAAIGAAYESGNVIDDL